MQAARYHKDFSEAKADVFSQHLRINSFKVAPNAYSPSYAIIDDEFTTRPNRIHFPISKAKKISCLEEYANSRAFIPGSDVYKHEDYRMRILNGKTTEDAISYLSDNAVYKGQNSARYNDQIDIDVVKNASPRHDPFKSRTERFTARKKQTVPSPGQYEPDYAASSRERKPPIPKLSKAQRLSFAAEASKKKQFVPAPGKYDTSHCYDFMTKGASRGYK